MSTPLAEMYQHNRWANLLLLDFCKDLTDEQLDTSSPGGFGSIRDTLHHILAAEERYVHRLTGREPSNFVNVDETPTLSELRSGAEWSGEQLEEAASKVRPGETLESIFDGKGWEIEASVQLTQALHHGNEHRAQIATTLTTLGIEPPNMSAWAWGIATNKMRTL